MKNNGYNTASATTTSIKAIIPFVVLVCLFCIIIVPPPYFWLQ